MIKNYLKITLLFFVFSTAQIVKAQKPTAFLLKEPAEWELERFDLPPAFVPGFPYKGFEELRFSPGMFQKDSVDYFTYAFVVQLDNRASFSQDDIKNYILTYYKGLCSVTARDRKLVVDTSTIKVSITKHNNEPGNEMMYDARADIFGVFTDGAPVKLNMEIKVFNNAAAKKTHLLFIVSPREKGHAVWKTLYQVQKDFTILP